MNLQDYTPPYTVRMKKGTFFWPVYQVVYDELTIIMSSTIRSDAYEHCELANTFHRVGYIDGISAEYLDNHKIV